MFRIIWIFSFLFFVSQAAFAQQLVLSGDIFDAQSGERILNANITILELEIETKTNNYGLLPILSKHLKSSKTQCLKGVKINLNETVHLIFPHQLFEDAQIIKVKAPVYLIEEFLC